MNQRNISPTRPRKPVKASDLEAMAAEALGGPAVKPPALPTRAIRPKTPLPAADAEAREAFTLATGGAIGPKQAAALGNTTFDGIPDEMATRRQKVAGARARLADLASRVLTAHADILPVLDDLADDAEGLKAGEAFDCEVARGFLNGLKSVVEAISPKAEPAAAAETPAEESPEA